ncbi:MAG: enoyl-CoA hydratase-related protein [Hyphomicrobiales bacterium]|nr:enoyl-CoA hydratase-related protein [Hyphomicrobiales bacterium]
MTLETFEHSALDDRLKVTVTDAGLCLVRIDQPRRRNALTLAMWQGLTQVFARASEAPEVRSVVLTGEGGHFCAGADISEFDAVRYDSQSAAHYDAENDRAVAAIRDCPKPVIAAMSGAAVGGGLSLALACDFRVADATLTAGIPAARLGLVYSLVDCTLLHTRLGVTRAKEILFSGRLFGLEDAVRLGLVDRVAGAAEDALQAATAFAAEFEASAPLSVRGHKAIFQAMEAGEVEARREELEALISAAFDSDDYREGRRAFAERRDPVFTGR